MDRRLSLLTALAVLAAGCPSPAGAQDPSPGTEGSWSWDPLPATTTWELVPDGEVIDPVRALAPDNAPATTTTPPTTRAEARELLSQLPPGPDDYQAITTLGSKFPTAFVLPDGEMVFSAFQLSPVAGGGAAGGSGNQNFVAQVDLGLADSLQLSIFFSDSDDPLFAQPVGLSPNPANLWQSVGVGAQWQLIRQQGFGLALSGSLESFLVQSGGCRVSDSTGCSPNIFNGLAEEVSTNNLVGSLSVPLTWKPSPSLDLTLAPGVSFLPDKQGPSGAQGDFFGTNVTLSAGVLWKPIPTLRLYGSALMPLGPGTNTFDQNLDFSRVPIFSGGVQYALNPRIAFDLALSNGFGASPATALLTLPSSNELLWMARWSYVPGASDSAALPWNERSRSLTLGGLTVGTALIPPSGRANVWFAVDNKSSLFGHAGYSLSNDFQIFWQANVFEDVGISNSFAQNFAGSSGTLGNQVGGKAIFLHQLRGAPFSLAAAASFGQESTTNYLFGELNATWEANRWLALNLNPKFVNSGIGTPMSIGLGANIQIARSLQLIPELNIAANDTAGSNGTLALRWMPTPKSAIDIFVTNAAGLLSTGQLLENVDQTRIGTRVTFQF